MADLDFFEDRTAIGDVSASAAAAPLDFFADRPVVRPADPNSPFQKSLGHAVSDDPAMSAGALLQGVGSLPTEPQARVEFFAKQRFPNLPLSDAMQRYGIKGGRIYYVNDEGRAFYEESEAKLPGSFNEVPAAVLSTGRAMAGSAGPALPVAGGTVGGVLTYPFMGGVPGATAGGALGDATRQAGAAFFTGEEKPVIDRVMQTGGAALQEGAGQLAGAGMAKGLSYLGRTPVYDIPASTETGKMAKRFDIPLTAGEQTGSKTLIRRQKILGSTTEGEDVFEGFYRMRNEKVRSAVYKVLDALSPEQSVRGASQLGVEGAQAAKDVERKALQRLARPHYREAEAVADVNIQPVLDLIDDKLTRVSTPVATKLRRIRANLVRRGQNVKKGDKIVATYTPEERLARLDEVKKWLDDEIAGAGRADSGIGTAQSHHLKEIRKLLIGQADEASEAYAKARGIYEEGMPSVAKVEKGIVGDIAKLEQNDVLSATRMLFSARLSSPQDVKIARLAFNKAGKQAEWNALIRAHVQDTLEGISESTFGNVTNLGGALFKKLVGSPKQAAMLREALQNSPATMQDVMWLTRVLQATGKAAKGESITAFAQAGQRELARESKPLLASALETAEIWRTPSRAAQFWANVAEGRYARRMSEILTSPDGIKQLRELRTLSPKSKGAVIAFAHLLTASGVAEAGEFLSPTADVEPGGFSATMPNPQQP